MYMEHQYKQLTHDDMTLHEDHNKHEKHEGHNSAWELPLLRRGRRWRHMVSSQLQLHLATGNYAGGIPCM